MTKKTENRSSENAIIKVIGVGGGGGNSVNQMIEDGFTGAEFIVINTDNQVLKDSKAEKVLIGQKATRGLGAGANPEVGKKAAEENRDEIKKQIEGADLLYIAAGMGGGTGTGAAPIVAQIASEMDILTIGIVTLPFSFEGRKRMRQALAGKKELSKYVDTLITVPNDKILESLDEKEANELSFEDAMALADSVLSKATRGVTALINKPGKVNLDFADIRTVVKVGGSALMGMGEAKGENAAEQAAKLAMTNPLLMHGMVGAKGVIMNFTSSRNHPFLKITQAATLIETQADEESEILFGHVIAEEEDWEDDRISVTIVATGFVDEDTEFKNRPRIVEEPVKAVESEELVIQTSRPANVGNNEVRNESRSFSSVQQLREDFQEEDLNIPTFLRSKYGR